MKYNRGVLPITIFLGVFLLLSIIGLVYVMRHVPNTYIKNEQLKEIVAPTNTVSRVTRIADEYNRYVGDGCKIMSGCNGPIVCVDEDVQSVNTTCESLPEYACYMHSIIRCEKQLSSGKCGWTQTPALRTCIRNARN